MIKVVAKNTVKADKIEEFKQSVTVLAMETRKEDGCISYQLYQDVKDDRILTFIEEWAGEEALAKHMKSKHFTDIVPKLDQMKEKDMELNIYRLAL